MKKRGQIPVGWLILALLIVLLLLVLFVSPNIKTEQNEKTSCLGVWKTACWEHDTNLGVDFADYADNEGKVCCLENLCRGVWRDVVECTSSAGGTSIGRAFSDADLKLNRGKVCCSR